MAGKAARNWAIGWITRVQRGLSPIQTPIGTQTAVTMAIAAATRISV